MKGWRLKRTACLGCGKKIVSAARARCAKCSANRKEVRVFDIRIENHGTLFLFSGASQEGQVWLETHLDPSGQKWGEAFVVEHRYAQDIAVGAVADGLRVH